MNLSRFRGQEATKQSDLTTPSETCFFKLVTQIICQGSRNLIYLYNYTN